jgi:hypothetical protein
MSRLPNLLLLGASGGVANAVLRLLPEVRDRVGALVLVSRHDRVTGRAGLDHEALRATFVTAEVDPLGDEKGYRALLRAHKADLVVDLTDADSLPLIEATDRAGVGYLNTAMNGSAPTDELLGAVFAARDAGRLSAAAHVLCGGMNPGNVNAWVAHGIAEFGVPARVTHFEFDTSMAKDGWKPLVTWSRAKFLVEAAKDEGGVVLGRGAVERIKPTALANLTDMRPVLEPFVALEEYPSGLPVLHEENVTIGHRFDVPSAFIYSLHPRTMRYLAARDSEAGVVLPDDLALGDNVTVPLDGRDLIGVRLSYPDRQVYYSNGLANAEVSGTSATYHQVAVGVVGATLAWLEGLGKGVHFPEELGASAFPEYLFEKLLVTRHVFAKTPRGLELESRTERVTPTR